LRQQQAPSQTATLAMVRGAAPRRVVARADAVKHGLLSFVERALSSATGTGRECTIQRTEQGAAVRNGDLHIQARIAMLGHATGGAGAKMRPPLGATRGGMLQMNEARDNPRFQPPPTATLLDRPRLSSLRP
jgi:hypothetical protein